jgi:ligand-binding sensor domain-containing protein
MEDRSGNIWFAFQDKGVFRYDGQAIEKIAEKEGLGNNVAGGLAQDKAGNLWFTMKNGICKYDGKTFTEDTAKDGLRGNEFGGIYIEQLGIIWVTTRGSTTRFDPAISLPNPKAFTMFTSAHGINCCVQSMYQDKSGNMWWGTGQGLFRFNGYGFYKVKKNGPW